MGEIEFLGASGGIAERVVRLPCGHAITVPAGGSVMMSTGPILEHMERCSPEEAPPDPGFPGARVPGDGESPFPGLYPARPVPAGAPFRL